MPAKRVLISIDERVLARIDEAVQRRGQTRSGFLAQAAIAQIEGGELRRDQPDRELGEPSPSRQA